MIGGSSRIRTHGPFRAFSFQDCCLKPCSAILPYFGSPSTDRTYDIFVNSEAQLPLCYRGIDWWRLLGSNQSCPKAADLQSTASPLMLHLRYWCPGRDSNSQLTASKTAVFTNFTTGAIFAYKNTLKSAARKALYPQLVSMTEGLMCFYMEEPRGIEPRLPG